MSAEPTSRTSPTDAGPAAEILKPTLADEAYEELKRRILTLELEPGAQFREADIAATLGLGKTPVREALLRLGLEDLVRVQSRSGYTVAPVTLKGARDLCETRALIEGEASFRAASARGGATEEFCAAYSTLDGTGPDAPGEGTAGDLPALLESERAFHLALARTSGNELLAKMLAGLLESFSRLCHLAAALGSDSLPVAHDHSALVNAIASGDAGEARSLVVGEVRTAETLLIQALLSSESLASANVDPTPAVRAQTFYLDVPTDNQGGGRAP